MTAKIIPNIDALEIIEESINAGKTVRLKVRGNSMSPLLMDGVDHVILHPCNAAEITRGDIIFFRYKEGFLLYRVIRVDHPANQFDNRVGCDSGGRFGYKTSGKSADSSPGKDGEQFSGDYTVLPGGTVLITTRGDALSKTETITFSDVIAIAGVPRHTFTRKAF